jgi:hypothetical protein
MGENGMKGQLVIKFAQKCGCIAIPYLLLKYGYQERTEVRAVICSL